MSATPHLPIQRSLPSGGRFKSHGGDKWGAEIDGGAGRSGYIALTPRHALIAGETPSLIGTALVKSSLQSTRNGYEGLGLWKIIRNDAGQVVWHNNPVSAGNTDWWVNDLPSDWGKVSIIVQTPHEHQGTWMQMAFVVRAPGGGQIQFDMADGRSHYRLRYGRPNPAALADQRNFRQTESPSLFGGRAGRFWARYMQTHQVRIPAGQRVKYGMKGWINEAYCTDASPNRPKNPLFRLMVCLKILYADGSESWEGASNKGGDTTRITDQPLEANGEFVAWKAIQQVEQVMIFMGAAIRLSPGVGVSINHEVIEGFIETGLQLESGAG